MGTLEAHYKVIGRHIRQQAGLKNGHSTQGRANRYVSNHDLVGPYCITVLRKATGTTSVGMPRPTPICDKWVVMEAIPTYRTAFQMYQKKSLLQMDNGAKQSRVMEE